MKYDGLPLNELASLSITDQGARGFIADNAERLLVDSINDAAFDDAEGCYDDGYSEGRGQKLRKLAGTYSEQLLEWIDKVPDLALAGDGNLAELETLLAALHAEFEDD